MEMKYNIFCLISVNNLLRYVVGIFGSFFVYKLIVVIVLVVNFLFGFLI